MMEKKCRRRIQRANSNLNIITNMGSFRRCLQKNLKDIERISQVIIWGEIEQTKETARGGNAWHV